jgi:hypothetical protein
MNETSGPTSGDWYAQWTPDGWSLKTSQALLFQPEKSERPPKESWKTLLKRGGLRNGRLYKRDRLAHHTSGSGGSCWPTAHGLNAEHGQGGGEFDKMVRNWATPVSQPANGTPEDFIRRKKESVARGNSMGLCVSDLNMQVQMWSTPQAHDVTERGSGQQPNSTVGNACLARDARTWPTPNCGDSKGHAAHKRGNQTLNSASESWLTPRSRDHKGSGNTTERPGGKSRLDQLDFAAENFPSSHQAQATHDGQSSSTCAHSLNLLCETTIDPALKLLCEERFVVRLRASTVAQDERWQSELREKYVYHFLKPRLNPRFVSVLMGWPLSWTSLAPIDCESPAMASWKFKRQSLFDALLTDLQPTKKG